MKCPCKGCDRRTITCHGVCKEYEAWKKFNDDRNEWLRSHKYEPTNGLKKGVSKSIKDTARGYKKKKVKKYD